MATSLDKTKQFQAHAEHLKRIIRRDHPKLSEKEVSEVFSRIDTLSDILLEEWIALKNHQNKASSHHSK